MDKSPNGELVGYRSGNDVTFRSTSLCKVIVISVGLGERIRGRIKDLKDLLMRPTVGFFQVRRSAIKHAGIETRGLIGSWPFPSIGFRQSLEIHTFSYW